MKTTNLLLGLLFVCLSLSLAGCGGGSVTAQKVTDKSKTDDSFNGAASFLGIECDCSGMTYQIQGTNVVLRDHYPDGLPPMATCQIGQLCTFNAQLNSGPQIPVSGNKAQFTYYGDDLCMELGCGFTAPSVFNGISADEVLGPITFTSRGFVPDGVATSFTRPVTVRGTLTGIQFDDSLLTEDSGFHGVDFR